MEKINSYTSTNMRKVKIILQKIDTDIPEKKSRIPLGDKTYVFVKMFFVSCISKYCILFTSMLGICYIKNILKYLRLLELAMAILNCDVRDEKGNVENSCVPFQNKRIF